jgi:hypothetical protein
MKLTAQQKILEYEQLRQQAHSKVDTLRRDQLKKFLKRNGREVPTRFSGTPQKEGVNERTN